MRALMYFSEVPKLSVLMSAVRLGSSRLPHERADAPFFMPSSRVSPSSYPAGAPRGGGTPITLRGAGFRDLGGARPGVFCKFGGAEDLVPAEGGGEDEIVCASPPLPDVESGAACAAAVTIEVTLNGDNPVGGAAMYAGADGARFQIGDVEGVA